MTKVGLVGHVARQRGVVAEDGVFGDHAVVADGLEESPKVGLQFVPRSAGVGETSESRLRAGLRIVLLVPLFHVALAHFTREAAAVVAGGVVLAGLREIFD